ncbi:hypothetical protein Pmani_029273 [Petrolisthes manimaculis]|uniref:Uncharacterized protein n=1 Tax=Petrolisthes manimaculis TaxID=1843537 RepID=A0AAE1TU15_9EUCA|nr:hypothetical protein Pmani_029273 [Petrolisthes manimaculis]
MRLYIPDTPPQGCQTTRGLTMKHLLLIVLTAHLVSWSGADQKAAATFNRRTHPHLGQDHGRFLDGGHGVFLDTRSSGVGAAAGGGGGGGVGLNPGSIIVRGNPLNGNFGSGGSRLSEGLGSVRSGGSPQDIYTLRGSIENRPSGNPSVVTLSPGTQTHSQGHSTSTAVDHGSKSRSNIFRLTKNDGQNNGGQGITTILVRGGNASSSRLSQSGLKPQQERPAAVLPNEHKKPIYITTLKPKKNEDSTKTKETVDSDSVDQKSESGERPVIRSSKGILVALGEGDGPLRLVVRPDGTSNIKGGAASLEKLLSKIEGRHIISDPPKKEHREPSSVSSQGKRTEKSVGIGQTKVNPYTFGSGLVSGNQHSVSQIGSGSPVGDAVGRQRITASDIISGQLSAEIINQRQKNSGVIVNGPSLSSQGFRQFGGLKLYRGSGGKIVTLSGERPGGTIVQTQDSVNKFNQRPSSSLYIDSQGRQVGPIGVHFSQEGLTNHELIHQGSVGDEGRSGGFGGEKVIHNANGQGFRSTGGGNGFISSVNGGPGNGFIVVGGGKNAFRHRGSGEYRALAGNQGHTNTGVSSIVGHEFIGTTSNGPSVTHINNGRSLTHEGPRGIDNTRNAFTSSHPNLNFRSHVGTGDARNQVNIPVSGQIVIGGGKERFEGVYQGGQGVSLVSSIQGGGRNTIVTSGGKQGSESIYLNSNEQGEYRHGDLRSTITEVVQNGGKANFEGFNDFTQQGFGQTIVPVNFGQIHQGGAPSGTEDPSSIYLPGANGNGHRFGGISGDKMIVLSRPPGQLSGRLGGLSGGRRVILVRRNEGKEHRALGTQSGELNRLKNFSGQRDEGKSHGAISSGHIAINNKGLSHVTSSPSLVNGHHQVSTLGHIGTTEKEVGVQQPHQELRRGHFSVSGPGGSLATHHTISSSPSPVELVGNFRRGQIKNGEGYIRGHTVTEGAEQVGSRGVGEGGVGVGHVVVGPGRTGGRGVGVTQLGLGINGRGVGQVVGSQGRGISQVVRPRGRVEQVVGPRGRGRERVIVSGNEDTLTGSGYSSTIGFGGGAVSSVSFNIGQTQR